MATANMKDIKRRIKSVESTMQITKAMELVASSKLRKAKQRAELSQPFFNALYETMCNIAEDSVFTSTFTKKTDHEDVLLVVIAGDRGLAGGFNSNVLKSAYNRALKIQEHGTVKIIAIGKKAVEFFDKRNFEIVASYHNISEDLTIYASQDITAEVINCFKTGSVNKVELFYTTFVSALVQEPQSMAILPVELNNSDAKKPSSTIYDPSPEAVFDGLIPRYLTGILFGAIVDSFASEQAARRTAMESASDNAGEMINNLSLVYNRARQTTITQEITEIVAGSNVNN